MSRVANGRIEMAGGSQSSWCFVLVLTVLLFPAVAWPDGGVVRVRETGGAFAVTVFTPDDIRDFSPTEVAVLVQNQETGEAVLDTVVDLSFFAPMGVQLKQDDPLCGPSDGRWLNLSSAKARTGAEAGNARGVTGVAPPAVIRAGRGKGSNKLFYGCNVNLRAVGNWQLLVSVRVQGTSVTVECTLPVEPHARPMVKLWPYLAIPPMGIVLFVMNQWLRRRGAPPSRATNIAP